MSAWNDDPPRGGPMVKVAGFPGPLYPPDHPKGPSPDSDFVMALKRTAARCGAWPWDPEGWDDSYSSRFAHGDNNPAYAGIAGLQEWSGTIDPTGNVGEATFNFLRSVKVPQGRTHAGEMAMDSVAVNLINTAYAEAHPPAVPLREAALSTAITQIGIKENPFGSNQVKYSDWYGMIGPWCAMFTTWCYETSGGSESFAKGQRYSYVPYLVSDAQNGRYGLTRVSTPLAGDLVCYDWESNGEFDHVGLFERWNGPTTFTAIEGNTSTSNNSNGGEVMRRSRDTRAQHTVFVRAAA